MHKFTPAFQGTSWTDGMHVLHVYALASPADADLHALVGKVRPLMNDYPIAPMDDAALHVTIDMVADRSAREIPPAERDALIDVLRDRLADSPPVATELGPPVCGRAGVWLDVDPEAELNRVRDQVRDGLRDARGDEVLQHDAGRLHLSLGYSWGTADSDPLNSTLRAVTPRRVQWHIHQVHLVDVAFHERDFGTDTGWEMTCKPLAAIPLGG